MKARLTEEMVRRLKPPDHGKLTVYDEIIPGLLLHVNAGGSKTWSVQTYRKTTAKSGKLAGQTITMPSSKRIGRYPILSLLQARDRAKLVLANPAAPGGSTFEQVMESYLERHVKAQSLRTAPEIERCLRVYALPHWQHRPFAGLRRADVTALMDLIVDKHGTRMADQVLSHIRSMMNFYARRNDGYTSPLVRGMERSNAAARERILSDPEIAALWKAAPALGYYGALCQVLLLTGQRRAKVETMKHADVVDGVWVIATAKREKGNAGTLRLPKLVSTIIAAQPRSVVTTGCFRSAAWAGGRQTSTGGCGPNWATCRTGGCTTCAGPAGRCCRGSALRRMWRNGSWATGCTSLTTSIPTLPKCNRRWASSQRWSAGSWAKAANGLAWPWARPAGGGQPGG
jgi:hypothetical protein